MNSNLPKWIFIVPIIPEFLYDIKHPNATLSEHLEGSASHQTTIPTTVSPTTTTKTTTPKCPCAQNISVLPQLEFLHVTTPSMDVSGKICLIALYVESLQKQKILFYKKYYIDIKMANFLWIYF